MKNTLKELKTFILLWSTQSLSQLGSAMTNFALVIWLYKKTGSALQTALLSICSYAPYVMMSIFAGALSDKWNKKKVMLVCDTLAAVCTVVVFVLLKMDLLLPIHMYVLNAINGLMNTVQQPAGDVAMTLITPEKHYQRTSGMRSFSQSLVTILTPVLATMILSFAGMTTVICVDLITFIVAFLTLLLFVKIPEIEKANNKKSNGNKEERAINRTKEKLEDNIEKDSTTSHESLLQSAREGLHYLKENRLVLTLILFLAGVNLVASAFDAVLPAMILSKKNGGDIVLGMVNAFAGIATLMGSIIVTLMPAPKNRVRVIYVTMLISLSTENFLIAFGHTPVLWCLGQIIGWILVPLMGANLDVILRTSIPTQMQGRVFSCRNTLQFFTIPVGFFLGGVLVDQIFEPLMATQIPGSLLTILFDNGKGSGAAFVMFILGVVGTGICLIFGKILRYEDKHSNTIQ